MTLNSMIFFFPFAISVVILFITKVLLSITYNSKIEASFFNIPSFVLLIIIVFFLTFEYYILGTNSLFMVYDEGDSFFPYYKLLAENSNKNIFFELSGGLFKNGILFDSKLISFQLIIFKIFKPFYSYIIFKILNALVLVVGFWFLTQKNIKYTFVLSTIYFASTPYISTISIAHLAGYSAIPLSVFLIYLYKPKHSYKNLVLFIYFCFISTSASFPHSILAHISAILAFPFIFERSKLRKNIILAFIWGGIFSSICLINNLPMIEYVINNKELLYRTSINNKEISFIQILLLPFLELFSKLRGQFIFLFVFLFCFICFIFNKNYIKTIIFVIPLFCYFFIKLISQLEIFNFFNSLRAEQVMLSLPIIILYSFYYLYSNNKFLAFLNKKVIVNCLTFITIFFLIDYKFTHLLHWLGQGSFKSNFMINEKLKQFLINDGIIFKTSKNQFANFRTVVIPTKITTGFTWYNKINSFDGYSNFFSKRRSKAWLAAFPDGRHNEQFITERYKFKLKSNQKKYISQLGSIPFLRKHGVKYYFSVVKLNDDFLDLKYQKTFFEKNNNFFNIQKSNIRRNFSKVDFYVYEDKKYSPIFKILDNKNNILCGKDIIIYKLQSSLEIDLRKCFKIKSSFVGKLKISLPNFHKIEIRMLDNKQFVVDQKDLEFSINFKEFPRKFNVTPIK